MAISGARYIVDNSVWARLATTPEVVDEFKRIVTRVRPDDILVCPPVALEFGFSAQTSKHHDRLVEQLSAFPDCPAHPASEDTLRLQSALWNSGLLRAAGSMDTLIASYALANQATVLHYDRDFEHIASVESRFRHQWILPRGSIR